MNIQQVILVSTAIGLLSAVGYVALNNGQTSVPRCRHCNVLYISIDPLPANHMGVYGYDRNTTPHLDRLASDSFVFTRAFSQSGHTLPSMYSTFTSMYPVQHKMVLSNNISRELEERDLVMLAEILRGAGYHTFSVNGGANIRGELGFSQGFELYHEKVLPNHTLRNSSYRLINKQTAFFIDTLANTSTPFFGMFQTFYPHDPYFPPEPYHTMFIDEVPSFHEKAMDRWFTLLANKTGQQVYDEFRPWYFGRLAKNDTLRRYAIAQFDGQIRLVDDKVGAILDALKEEGLYNNTIIIVNAQHGEQFGEHGKWRHATALYNEVIHVPLIIHLPGQTGQDYINTYVENIDIAPTLLALLGIESKLHDRFMQQAEGISLRPLLAGGTVQKPFLLAEVSDETAFIDPDTTLKYYRNGSKSVFYNLSSDFAERRPLPVSPITQRLKDRFEQIYAEMQREQTELSFNRSWPYLQ